MEKTNPRSYKIVKAIFSVVGVFLGSFVFVQAATVFYGNQVGNSATNGYVLQSTGPNSTSNWVATSTLGISGGSGGSGTISTSSPLTSGQPLYATGWNTIASVASSTFLTSIGGQPAGNYSTFAYPFPNNATSTSINFSGGIQVGILAGLGGWNNGTPYGISTSTPMNMDITGNAGTVTNGVYTGTFNNLFDVRLTATTSLPRITTLAGLTSFGSGSGLTAQNAGGAYNISTTSMNASISGSSGSVANSVTFNSSGGAATNTAFNGSSAITVDYHTVGAQIAGSYLTSYDAFTHPAAGQSATTSLMVFSGNATSTQLTVSGNVYLPLTGLLKGNGAGNALTVGSNGTDFTLLSVQTCSNQAITALTATGGSTCSSITDSFISGAIGTSHGGTASTTPLGGILVGNGTSAIKSLAIGTNLTFDGTTLNATGGGSSLVATSSQETAGQLAVWGTTNGFPARLYSLATSTATLGLGLSGSLTGFGTNSLSIATSSLYSGTTGQFPYFSGTNALVGTSTLSIAANGTLTVDNGLAGDALTQYGATSHEWSVGAKISDFTFHISSSTTLGTSDALSINKSTLVTTLSGLTLGTALSVANGGTGAITLTGCLTGNGTGAITGSGTCNTSNATVSSVGSGTGLTGGTITTTGTLSFAAIAANSLWVNQTGASAVPTVTATSSLFSMIGTGLMVLNNAPTFTGIATFANASTTGFSSGTNTFYIDATGHITAKDTVNNWSGVLSPTRNPSFGYATTTSWVATSSPQAMCSGPAPFAGTVRDVQASTDAGTLNLDIAIGTTHLTLVNASTTVGVFSFNASNTFTKGQVICAQAGTPASSPTRISATLDVTQTP